MTQKSQFSTSGPSQTINPNNLKYYEEFENQVEKIYKPAENFQFLYFCDSYRERLLDMTNIMSSSSLVTWIDTLDLIFPNHF